MPDIQGGNLYIGQDNRVVWGDRAVPNSGLYDTNLERFVNDATVTFQLKDSGGSNVSGGSGTMSYIAGSKGLYEGVLEDAVSLTADATYYLEITASASGDRVGFRRLTYTAQYQGST